MDSLASISSPGRVLFQDGEEARASPEVKQVMTPSEYASFSSVRGLPERGVATQYEGTVLTSDVKAYSSYANYSLSSNHVPYSSSDIRIPTTNPTSLPTYQDLGIAREIPRARGDQTAGQAYIAETKLPTYRDLGIQKAIPVRSVAYEASRVQAQPISAPVRSRPAETLPVRSVPPPTETVMVQRSMPPAETVKLQRAAAPPPPVVQHPIRAVQQSPSQYVSALRAAPPPQPQVVSVQQFQSASEVVGLGMLLEGKDDGSRYVKEIVPGMAAEQSREVQAGDEILEIDGTSLKGLHLDRIKALSINKVGTESILKLRRGHGAVVDVRARRTAGNRFLPSEYKRYYEDAATVPGGLKSGTVELMPRRQTELQAGRQTVSTAQLQSVPVTRRTAPDAGREGYPYASINYVPTDVQPVRSAAPPPPAQYRMRSSTSDLDALSRAQLDPAAGSGMRKVIKMDGTETYESIPMGNPGLYGSERIVRPSTSAPFVDGSDAYGGGRRVIRADPGQYATGIYGSLPSQRVSAIQ